MKHSALAVLALITACSTPELAEIQPADLDIEWRGVIEASGTCSSGEVSLSVWEVEEGRYEGLYDYVSYNAETEGAAATYALEGDLSQGELVLDQVDLVDASHLPHGYGWCFGEMSLERAVYADGDELVGQWVAANCGCDATLAFDDAM